VKSLKPSCVQLFVESWLLSNPEGVAPSSSSLCIEFESRRAKLAQQHHLRELNVLGKVGRKWCKKFRKHWSITYRKLKERKNIPPEELAEKVA